MPDARESRRHVLRSDPEHRFELSIDCVRDYAIVTLDPDGRIETWNLGAEVIAGHGVDEVVGTLFDTLFTTEDRSAGVPARLLAEARATGRSEVDCSQVRKDGSTRSANVVITAVRAGDGELLGFIEITRDLTESRTTEDLRLQQDERFRTLVENARDYAIFMLDPGGRVATWNEGAHRIKGYTADEIIGQHFSRFYLPEEVLAGKCELELEQALRDGRFEDEGWRVRKDGGRFWANVVIAPLFDRAGRHVGFSKITRDLTERRAAELNQLRLAHAHEALRLRDEFLSIASHELRTPLVALQLQLDSLRARPDQLTPKQRSKVERASRNVARLTELIHTLLDVSRIAGGRLTLALKQIDLGALIREVIDRLDDSAQAAACTVTQDLARGVEGSWDPLRIGQVISNLMANAFKYAAGTPIEVTLSRELGEAVIVVQDRGPGIAEEHLERIFERFERAVPARNFGGMGLGLYVAREIVIAHEGVIQASNRAGGGARIEVRLPIRTDAAKEVA